MLLNLLLFALILVLAWGLVTVNKATKELADTFKAATETLSDVAAKLEAMTARLESITEKLDNQNQSLWKSQLESNGLTKAH